jgi:hypothetical protein
MTSFSFGLVSGRDSHNSYESIPANKRRHEPSSFSTCSFVYFLDAMNMPTGTFWKPSDSASELWRDEESYAT